MKVVIVGAGLGGLTAACLLSSKGHEVTVYEKNKSVGGKMNEVAKKGFRFDTGPSLFTMPFILEEVLNHCGCQLDDELDLLPLEPLCRYFFPDGIVFDNFYDKDKNEEELRKFAPEDAQAYRDFLKKASSIYEKTASSFIFNPLFDLKDAGSLNYMDLLSINAFSTVSKEVDKHFQSDHLKQFFKRFTTYNGSSPYQAPATMNVIPHVELNQGGYYVCGGLYSIARLLKRLATKQGVEFRMRNQVEMIAVSDKAVEGIYDEHGKYVDADIVIANADATYTYSKLLSKESFSKKKKKKIKKIEPSCSGFVLLLGVEKQFDQLRHHNVFFSSDYQKEFKQIFYDKVMPDDPTIYVANTSYTEADHAPEGASNLYVLVNAPYVTKNYKWKDHKKEVANQIVDMLEERGLNGIREHLKYRKIITPKHFQKDYLSNKGSIYGTSSNNKKSAFIRPRNKSRDIDGLYLVGGSTHPGGGIPLVMQSALNALKLIERYEEED